MIPMFVGSVLTATTPNVYTVVATNAVNGCTATAQTVVFDNINVSSNASVLIMVQLHYLLHLQIQVSLEQTFNNLF